MLRLSYAIFYLILLRVLLGKTIITSFLTRVNKGHRDVKPFAQIIIDSMPRPVLNTGILDSTIYTLNKQVSMTFLIVSIKVS